MTKKYALHIGLKQVNPACYKGNNGSLYAPAHDVNAMIAITQQEDYLKENCKVLLNETATRSNFKEQIKTWQQQLKKDDLLTITFSGHGSRILNTDPEITDPGEGEFDETWCFYDGQVSDDEIYDLLAGFKAGARIFIISDSCFSGDITRELDDQSTEAEEKTPQKRRDIVASTLLISGTQENKMAYEAGHYSRFTTVLLKIWDEGQFKGDYRQFFEEIDYTMPDWSQRPNWLEDGLKGTTFLGKRPFS